MPYYFPDNFLGHEFIEGFVLGRNRGTYGGRCFMLKKFQTFRLGMYVQGGNITPNSQQQVSGHELRRGLPQGYLGNRS